MKELMMHHGCRLKNFQKASLISSKNAAGYTLKSWRKSPESEIQGRGLTDAPFAFV